MFFGEKCVSEPTPWAYINCLRSRLLVLVEFLAHQGKPLLVGFFQRFRIKM